MNSMNSKLCPGDKILADYIAGNLPGQETAEIEGHASGCKDCLWKISNALKADTLYKEGKLPAVPSKNVIKKPRKNTNLWLIAAIIAFIASFVFKRYFLQCLVATILLGIKWIAESENMRTLILVLDSWRRHERRNDDEIKRRVSDRALY